MNSQKTQLSSLRVRAVTACFHSHPHFLAWLLAVSILAPIKLPALIFYSTGDPSFNTTEPSGKLAGSGWQYVGEWGSTVGTAISPHLFITAKHVGGTVGQSFFFQNRSYKTVALFTSPDHDLAVWEICGSLPTYAPLYRTNDEISKSLVVFGRGSPRGAAVTITNHLGPHIIGWEWGPLDGRLRWGENKVLNFVDGGARLGSLLAAAFDASTGVNEATLGGEDSGSPVFIQSNGTWRLAAISYGASGHYSTTLNGIGFSAAIFDQRGLYVGEPGTWTQVEDGPVARPGGFFSTRIFPHLDWVTSIIATTPDRDPILQKADTPEGPYTDDPDSVLDSVSAKITLPIPAKARFYRLRGCQSFQLTGASLVNAQLEITYK